MAVAGSLEQGMSFLDFVAVMLPGAQGKRIEPRDLGGTKKGGPQGGPSAHGSSFWWAGHLWTWKLQTVQYV